MEQIYYETYNYLSMRTFTLLKITFVILFCGMAFAAWAAAPGPSDTTTPPPANASDVSQVVCFGSIINLKGPVDASNANYKRYQWYKMDSGGNKQLVQDSTINTYSETSAGAGYYTYQLVVTNTNDCSSDISDPFKVYVLPDLTPTITPAATAVCEKGASTTVLTANVTNTNFTYNYQWTRNGTDIAGATSNTYTVSEQNTGDVTFGVKVSYALNTGCTQTATQVIHVIALPGKPVITAGP